MLDFETYYEVSKSNSNNLEENNFFLENYISSEGAVSHNVLCSAFHANQGGLFINKRKVDMIKKSLK